jgi:hypothetical protein
MLTVNNHFIVDVELETILHQVTQRLQCWSGPDTRSPIPRRPAKLNVDQALAYVQKDDPDPRSARVSYRHVPGPRHRPCLASPRFVLGLRVKE